MKSADNIKRLFRRAELRIHLDTDEEVFKDVLQARRKSTKHSPAVPEVRRITMKNPLAKLTVAALVAIACVIALSLWPGTKSGIALADVLAQIEQVGTYRCRMSATFKSQDVDSMPISQATILIARDLGMRTSIEVHNPITGQSALQEIYVLPPKKIITTVMPKEKKYSQMEFDEAAFEGWQKGYDPRFMVEQILECKHIRLGKSTIDGVEVEGFQTTDGNYLGGATGQADIKIWVDVETKLPMRIEVDKSEENRGHMHIVVDDFQWDVPVDAAEFEPVIPDDYTPGRPMLQLLPHKSRPVNKESH